MLLGIVMVGLSFAVWIGTLVVLLTVKKSENDPPQKVSARRWTKYSNIALIIVVAICLFILYTDVLAIVCVGISIFCVINAVRLCKANAQPPQQSYAPPQQSYAPPQQNYAPPQQNYAPPQQNYAPPQQNYAPPQQSYAPPQQSYAPPQQSYAPPQQNYAPPQQNYAPPQQNVMPQQNEAPQNYQRQNVTPQIHQQENAAFQEMPVTTAVAVSAQLISVSGPLQGSTMDFSDQIIIGRDPTQCGVVFPADTPGISRKHCSVRVAGNSLMITDHGSSSGTFLANGDRVPSGQWVPVSGVFYLGNQQNVFSVNIK